MWKTEERGKGQDGEGGTEKEGVTSVVSSRRARPCSMGGSVWNDGGSGREGSEVKKDTKASRKSLNDKRSGQLGLGRQGPKGAAG